MTGARAGRRAAVFDLDGTLVDSAVAIAAALNVVRTERGASPLHADAVRPLVSRGAAHLVREVLAETAGDPVEDLAAFRRVYGAVPVDRNDLYPGAEAALQALARDGWTLGVCTNKPQRLTERLLDGMGLAPLFAAVVGGDAVEHCKPHPDHVFAILERLAAAPHEAVYVGDSEVDAEAAQAAGVPLVLVSFGYSLGPASEIACAARIDSFAELPTAFAASTAVVAPV